jgi:transposase
MRKEPVPLRARHRLSKFQLRQGRRRPAGVKAWTQRHLAWVKQEVHFEQPAQEFTWLDYVHEVEHATLRMGRLERALEEAIPSAPPRMRTVIEAWQALRGIAQVTAATMVAELGEVSRFDAARQLMGYSGMAPKEHSSGPRIWRGGITKTGNAHLRRVVTEAAWAYRHRPALGGPRRKRQEKLSEQVKEIAWKAQHRLPARYRKLTRRDQSKQQVVTAIGRELLDFIWAIGVQAESTMQLAG